MKIAYLFSGQGAQYIGMGKELLQFYPEIGVYFDKASKIVGYDMRQMCFEANEKLDLTENTQPAILTVSCAFASILSDLGFHADYVAGLSLGEYSALVESGVLTFEEAIEIVKYRGRFMSEAVPSGVGKMVAVLKTDRNLIQKKCEEATTITGKSVAVANYNTPGQIVIGGYVDAVDKAVDLLKEAGSKKLVTLNVSGPFHTQLLQPASEQLAELFSQFKFSSPTIPVISNVTARPHEEGKIQSNLIEQVKHPVLWEDSIRYLIEQGVTTFVEIGPGKTLSSFMKQIDKTKITCRVEDEKTLNQTLSILKGES